jgi:hypothetical protein
MHGKVGIKPRCWAGTSAFCLVGMEDIREGERADKVWYPIESPVIGRKIQIEGVMGRGGMLCYAATAGVMRVMQKTKKEKTCIAALVMRGIRKSPRRRTGCVVVDAENPTFMRALFVVRIQPARLALAGRANRRWAQRRMQTGRLGTHGRRRAWSLRPGS